MIMLIAIGRRATAQTDDVVTSGSVGIPVKVLLSKDFDGLQAVLTFACGSESADVAMLGQSVTVPPQVIATHGKILKIGIYATKADGTVVIPTVWAEVCRVHEGTKSSGIDPAEPTPSWAAQVQEWAHEAVTSATEAVETADSVREDMNEFSTESATVLADARAATTAANAGAATANQAATDLRAAAERGDFDGGPGPQGPQGDDYVLTSQDKADIADLINNPAIVELDAPTTLTLANATEYHLTNVSDLTITYPSGAFDCWLSIATASGTVTVSLPSSSYIGDPPTFGASETWELSIRNGVVVAGKAVPDAS